jgi:hypothetical protein
LPHRPTTSACEKTQFPSSCGPAGDVNYLIQIALHEVGQAASQPFLFCHRGPASQFSSPNATTHLPGPLSELRTSRNRRGGPGQVQRIVRRCPLTVSGHESRPPIRPRACPLSGNR